MKGIILAGGSGTRLYPVTKVISKQILPIYDKPMIYYPLSVLMLAEIREVLIISTDRDLPFYKELFGNGNNLGLEIKYEVQKKPNGIAEAFIIGEKFIGTDSVCLILGDNVFYGTGLVDALKKAKQRVKGATIFGYNVSNPSEFGVVEFSADNRVLSIEEKPNNPKSNYAVPGLYFYDNSVIDISKNVIPSKRGELEITSVNNEYLKRNILNVEIFGRGTAWLDTGTHRGLLDASNFVEAIQSRQGLFVACIEEIAFRMNYIELEQLKKITEPLAKTQYGEYLQKIIENHSKGDQL